MWRVHCVAHGENNHLTDQPEETAECDRQQQNQDSRPRNRSSPGRAVVGREKSTMHAAGFSCWPWYEDDAKYKDARRQWRKRLSHLPVCRRVLAKDTTFTSWAGWNTSSCSNASTASDGEETSWHFVASLISRLEVAGRWKLLSWLSCWLRAAASEEARGRGGDLCWSKSIFGRQSELLHHRNRVLKELCVFFEKCPIINSFSDFYFAPVNKSVSVWLFRIHLLLLLPSLKFSRFLQNLL